MAWPFIASVVAGMIFVVLLSYGYQIASWTAKALYSFVPKRYTPSAHPGGEHIQVLVLGDIGRSPRMQYHAISIAKHGRKVDIIGYKETARHPDLIGNPSATVYPLKPYPEWIEWGNLSFMIVLPYKVLHQFWTLFNTLMYETPPAKWIIIQNPPSIPTFHVALLVSIFRGSKLLIDWHNYGHTILAQRPLIKYLAPVYKFYEMQLGKYVGTANLAVTDAMTKQLSGGRYNLRGPVVTLHDRPASIFQPIPSKKDRLAFLQKLAETKNDAQDIVDGTIRLVVSSTSWTADEDFGILLDALMDYATPSSIANDDEVPSPILAIITGKGPQKQAYLEKIKELEESGRLPGIRVTTAWLSNRDYASLLSCADLGVSLHKSSSGVDLPMKVLDMFGAGLPVAAYSAFESAGELIKEGVNGCGFETAADLTQVLRRLLSMTGEDELRKLKDGAITEGSLRWDEEWNRVAGKILGFA